jgi:hypothetical protein
LVIDSLAAKSFLFFTSSWVMKLFQLLPPQMLYCIYFLYFTRSSFFCQALCRARACCHFQVSVYLSVHVATSSLFRFGCPDLSLHGDEVLMHPNWLFRYLSLSYTSQDRSIKVVALVVHIALGTYLSSLDCSFCTVM